MLLIWNENVQHFFDEADEGDYGRGKYETVSQGGLYGAPSVDPMAVTVSPVTVTTGGMRGVQTRAALVGRRPNAGQAPARTVVGRRRVHHRAQSTW